jgi:hypothetical protein
MRDRRRAFAAGVKRGGLPIATIVLFLGSLGSSEAICRADCEAASRSGARERPASQAQASCHDTSETPPPSHDRSSGCARHSRDCSLTAGGGGDALSGSRVASRGVAMAPWASGASAVAATPIAFAPARERPIDASPPPSSSVLRL